MEGEGTGKYIAAYIVSDEKIDIEALNNFILEEQRHTPNFPAMIINDLDN